MKLWVVIRTHALNGKKCPVDVPSYWREYDDGMQRIQFGNEPVGDGRESRSRYAPKDESPIIVPAHNIIPWAVRLGDKLAFTVENGQAHLTRDKKHDT